MSEAILLARLLKYKPKDLFFYPTKPMATTSSIYLSFLYLYNVILFWQCVSQWIEQAICISTQVMPTDGLMQG